MIIDLQLSDNGPWIKEQYKGLHMLLKLFPQPTHTHLTLASHNN